MKPIRFDRHNVLDAVQRTLLLEGVVIVPTDTLYGLSARLSSEKGHRRILDIKRGGSERPFVHLASTIDMVERYVDSLGCVSRETLERVWPAPLTAVFDSGSECPGWVGRTIAFRVPEHVLLRETIDRLGEPIVSTSVNRTGQPPLRDIEVIEREFGALVDLIVIGGDTVREEPSTLVDFTGSQPVVLREGRYDWAGDGNPSN